MRKLILIIISVFGSAVGYGQTEISSLSTAVQFLTIASDGVRNSIMGQSFQPSASYVLDSAKVKLKKGASATGDVNVRIYEHTGTFGVNGVATGSPLATSNTIDMSTVSDASAGWYKFTFAGSNAITLTSGTAYVVAVYYAGMIACNVYRNTTGTSHAGNMTTYFTDWSSTVSDMGHYVYGHSASTTSVKAINGVTQATVSKLAGVTMSGVKKFNGVANQ